MAMTKQFTMPAQQCMEVEKRRRQRIRTFRNAKVVFDKGATMLNVIVRNRSERGACLEIQAGTSVPERFRLLLSPEERQHECRVAWRRGNRLGVEYLNLI